MSFYGDLGRASGDLLKKDFPDGSKANVEVNTTTNSGVNVVFKAKRNADNTVTGTLEPKFKCNEKGLELSGVIANDKCKWTLSHSDKLYKGLVLKAGCDCSCKGGKCNSALVAEAKFKNDKAGVAAVLTFPGDSADTKVDVSALVLRNKLALGGSATYTMGNTAALTSSAAGVQLTQSDFVATAQVKGKHTKTATEFTVVGNYVHKLTSRNASVAGEVSYDVSKKEMSIRAAGQLNLDDGATVKARITHKGRAAFAYSAALGSNARITLASEVDTVNCCGDAKDSQPQFSVNIKFQD